MKLAFGVFLAFLGVGWGLAPRLRQKRLRMEAVSEQWLTEQDARDAITRGQVEGVVGQWPMKRRT